MKMKVSLVLIPVMLSGCALFLPDKDAVTISFSGEIPDSSRVYAIVPGGEKEIKKHSVVYAAFKKALSESLTANGYDVRSTFGDVQQVIKIGIDPVRSFTTSYTYKSPIYGVTSIHNEVTKIYDSDKHEMVSKEKMVPDYGITGYEDKTNYNTWYYTEVDLYYYSRDEKGKEKYLGCTSVKLDSQWKIDQKAMVCLAQFVRPYLFPLTHNDIKLKSYRWQMKNKCK
ncbi:hypothetical protein [Pantoea agglomerans]|uniref:hypothetical protein n=1 Tax=Enterobacter agglomerans TaxID=549 RepID=UPI003019C7E4